MTDRCDIERCSEKVCPGKRQCVEDIITTSCRSENDSQCRQYIKTRCALPPLPTDCSKIMCGTGMYCREKKGGKGVKCARARNCDQLSCSEGFFCSETVEGPVCRSMEDVSTSSQPPKPTFPTERPTPFVPTATVSTPFPNFCDFCAGLGQVCEVVNGSYQCTEPTGCDSVRVDYCLNTLGQLCEEINGTAECVFAESCSDINCPSGTICNDFGSLAFCNPVTVAETCEQLNCERIPGQVCEQSNDSAVCVIGCTADFMQICAIAQARCEVVNGFPECVREVKQDCEELVCTEGGTCVHVSLPSRNFSLAQCVALQLVEFFPTIEQFMCPGSPTPQCQVTDICTDVFQDGKFLTFVCNNFTTNCIDDTTCGLNEGCIDAPSGLGAAISFTSICLPTDKTVFELGASCASGLKQCPSGLVCQDVFLEGVAVGASCGFPSPILFGSSCAELEPCQASLECVESFVAGKGGLAQCVDKTAADSLFELFMSILPPS